MKQKHQKKKKRIQISLSTHRAEIILKTACNFIYTGNCASQMNTRNTVETTQQNDRAIENAF